MNDLSGRSTEDVLDDHIRCRKSHDVEGDLARNYASDVVILTSGGCAEGHDAVRRFHRMLREHVPPNYEIPLRLVDGPFAFIEWRAREPGKSVEDGADSFVVRDGKIVFQSIHYSIQQVMPL